MARKSVSARLSLRYSRRRSRSKKSKIKNSIFMHGVWNREAFLGAIEAHQKPARNERQILCQLALAGEFIYVDQHLFNKTYYNRPLAQRRPQTDLTIVAKKQKSRIRELADTLMAVLRSPLIDWNLKLSAVPMLALYFFYHRVRIGDELSLLLIAVLKRTFTRSQLRAVKNAYHFFMPSEQSTSAKCHNRRAK